MLLLVNDLRELCRDECIAVTKHTKNRFAERKISIDDIKNAIRTGEIYSRAERFAEISLRIFVGRRGVKTQQCLAALQVLTTKHDGKNPSDILRMFSLASIIKQFEDDKPFPSCLLLGIAESDAYIHVVASIDNGYLYIITAYYPDENEWDDDLKTRRER